MDTLVAILIVAMAVEGIVEYLLGDIASAKAYLRYVAAGLGVVAALAFGLDLFAAVGIHAPYPWAGMVLTGLMIGRGSNYLNDFIDRLKTGKAPAA